MSIAAPENETERKLADVHDQGYDAGYADAKEEAAAEIERQREILATIRREVGTPELDDAGVRMRIKILLNDVSQQNAVGK